MRTRKNKKNKRNTRKGGMFRRTQPEPQIGYYTEHHPHYNVGNSSIVARNLYKGKNAKAYVVPNTQIPTNNQLRNFEIAIQIPEELRPYKMNKIDIETFGIPIETDKKGYLSNTTDSKKVFLLMNTLDYGLIYNYEYSGKYSYYVRLPKSIQLDHIIYPLYILPSQLSKDIQVYEIPDSIIKRLNL
jgi:hypothetical protein